MLFFESETRSSFRGMWRFHTLVSRVCGCVFVCARACVLCARASLTLHSPVELLFPDSRRTIRRTVGLERQRRKCGLFSKSLLWLPSLLIFFFFLELSRLLVLFFSFLNSFRGGQQTGMDLPIVRQDTPSSSPPKFWLSSLPLDPGAEGSAELWRSICGNWWPHVRTFGDKYMSERLFAALYYISHGVSKLAPSQNYCQCDRSACAAAPEQKDRVCLTHYCKILQQINSFGFKKNKDISFTRKLVLFITPTIPECVKVSIGDQNNETCRWQYG